MEGRLDESHRGRAALDLGEQDRRPDQVGLPIRQHPAARLLCKLCHRYGRHVNRKHHQSILGHCKHQRYQRGCGGCSLRWRCSTNPRCHHVRCLHRRLPLRCLSDSPCFIPWPGLDPRGRANGILLLRDPWTRTRGVHRKPGSCFCKFYFPSGISEAQAD